ncbi:MAG: hypothetical protein RML14_10110 [Meiothermus sp.]|uniref:beta strand repeat-containing protein n=1 Tax=Meiothermus sp. TaxID=1955249 RepID=UPI00298F0BDB|nr:hypothetical protein [Meiothermus sp.]MDW8482200.1 hypothetical protein [Meiothermus sp.]
MRRTKLKGPLAILAALALIGIALAQPTPAGTSISNQASARYVDSAGQPRTTTSNQVVTVVQQVYSLTITPNGSSEALPGQTRSALPGATVYFAYTVSNTGNGTDTIALTTPQGTADNFNLTGVTVYRDDNCNGALDAGETAVSSLTLSHQGTPSSSACVVVAATIPAGTPAGQYANLNLVGTSSGGPSDSDNWARANVTAAAALTANKSASPSGPVTPGTTITYTIFGQNTGGSAASGVSVPGLSGSGILIRDIIPAGLEVNSLPTGSAGAGTVQIVYSADGTNWAPLTASNLPLVGNGSVAVGMFISGSGAFFPQGASYTFSFQARVPLSAPAGTAYTNAATVRFNDGTQQQVVTTNGTTNPVAASPNVAVGPYGYPTGGATGSYTAGSYTVGRSGDTQSITSAYSGSVVIFRHTLRNTGNAADSFTLSHSGAPSGWVCQFLADDLTTPLSGPVGPVSAGGDYSFALRCAIPAGYTATTAQTITVTATSQAGPTQSDSTTNLVQAVVSGYAVDLARLGSGGDGDPSNDNPPSASANPGTQVNFPIEVVNTGNNPDSFNLSATLPSGWSALFYPDANCDGVMDTPTPSPITNTGVINPGGANRRCYIAVVQIPGGTAPGANPISLRVDSATDTDPGTPGIQPASSDTVSTTVNVNLVVGLALDPDRSGTVTSPGTITYTHNLTNTGNANATVSIPAVTSAYGWTYELSTDGSTWSASLSGISVPAGGSVPLYVRVQVPGGQPIGRSETATLTANATYPSGTASDTATVTTTIVGGELNLTKSAVSYAGATTTVRHPSGAQAYPGDQIVYTVVASNIGTGSLTNVRVSDPLPAHTTFVSASATASGFGSGAQVLYSTNGTTWSTTPPTSLPTGGILYVGVDTDGNGTIDGGDVMPAGASITLSLRVQVQ